MLYCFMYVIKIIIIVNYRVIVTFSFITKHFTNSLTHFQLYNSQQRFNRLMYTMTLNIATGTFCL